MASFTLGNVPSAVGRYTMPRQDFNVGGFSPAPVGQPTDPRVMPMPQPYQPFIPPAIAKDPTKPGNFIDPGTGQPYAGGTSNQTGQVTLGGVPAPAGGGGFVGNIQRIMQALQQNPQLLQQLRQQGGAAAMQQPGVFGNVARAVSAAPALAAGTPQAASGMGAPTAFMQQYGPQMQAMYPQVAPDGTNGMPPMTGSGYGGGTQRPAQPQQPFPMF